ncbi:alpha/beta hydrolase [Leptospira barantonii]|uniref:Alpha/beta hydrolase n=1 Tax=Leptospira barantonii TaxID=2023184 RepID=A0ABX4NNS6_9LEPT|nr:alpha/beta fold hydrolase [Leptospira barantonii]PJZ58312.1 alpha/beta hydrolase [Leptospira barantonii]
MIQLDHYPAVKKTKTSSQNRPPILFVHGAWHGAWCWKDCFVPHFQKAGYEVYSIDLRGHGNSPNGSGSFRWNSIRNYVQDVEKIIGSLPQTPILIGHSMGGLVVQKTLEKTNAPKAVLLASVPPHGVFRITLELLVKFPIKFLKVLGTLSLLPIVEDKKIARELFFSKLLNEDKALGYASKMQNESFLAFLDMLLFCLPSPKKVKTPILVLGGEKDRFFVPWEVKRTAKAYQTEAEIFSGMGHNMMLDAGWEKVADRIETYLGTSSDSVVVAKKQKPAPKKKAKPKKKVKKK